MSFELYISVIPFCIIPVILFSIDYLNKNSDLRRRSYNVVDFDKYVKRKEAGDAVDNDIAKLLDIDKIAA